MKEFTFYNPVKYFFGSGVVRMLGQHAPRFW